MVYDFVYLWKIFTGKLSLMIQSLHICTLRFTEAHCVVLLFFAIGQYYVFQFMYCK